MACVGHAALDHVFEVEQIPGASSKTLARRYQALAGGMALHASIAAARLGASVRLIGRVGDDTAADFLRWRIAAEGVEPRGLACVRGGSTSLASVIVDAQGERQIVVHRGDALTRAHPLDTRELEGADVVLADPRWPDGAAAALDWARRRGVLSVLDAELAPLVDLDRLVPLAQCVAFSQAGLDLWARGRDTDAALAAVLKLGPQMALVTQGAAGARFTQRDHPPQQVAAPQVTAIDTTGAGDVFHAALAIALAERQAAHDVVRWACAGRGLQMRAWHGQRRRPDACRARCVDSWVKPGRIRSRQTEGRLPTHSRRTPILKRAIQREYWGWRHPALMTAPAWWKEINKSRAAFSPMVPARLNEAAGSSREFARLHGAPEIV